jgi:phytoene dehydrogenase-like protein
MDVVVVGAGPNGLAAAITLARAGRSVLVVEAAGTVGGGTRSAALTLPGFWHDVCSAIHPLAAGSPFFRSVPLRAHGLELVHAPYPLAHPLDDGTAVLLKRSVEGTAADLGRDEAAYRTLMTPLVRDWPILAEQLLGPLRVPRQPVALARFGVVALRSAAGLACARFAGARARALLAGLAAHSMLPLDRVPSAAFALVLGALGHVYGWPVARGGSQRIADALTSCLRALGGTVVTGHLVESVDEVAGEQILLDVTPRQLLRMAGTHLPHGYQRRLTRYRYGPGVYKMDWALDGPIPWRAAACAEAATVHVGGTLEDVVEAEAAVGRGQHPERPFVLLAQQSLFDETRAPEGKHTAWAYCHVPVHSRVEMAERIERQIERFAPGFRDRILARHAMPPKELEHHNPNYVGGDINGGSTDFRQLFTRPVARLVPYATPIRGLYLCSASTPPGGGVHGMCGYWAAKAALRAMQSVGT